MKKSLFSLITFLSFSSVLKAQNLLVEPDSCLISKYYFNSGTVNDDFGPNNGKQVGATLVPDRWGNPNSAWYLNGTPNSYINFGTTPNLKPNDISVSMWFKVNAPNFAGSGYNYNPLILTKCQTGGSCHEAYCLYYDIGTNKIATACTQIPCNQPNVWTGGSVPSGSWHHIVFTYDNNTITLYLDAVSQGTVSKGFASTYLSTDSVMVGNNMDGTNYRYFNGTVDDIRFYHCVIPQYVVTTLYNEPNWFVPTGIKSNNVSMKTDIFPNPTTGEFTVTVNKLSKNSAIEIYNTMGQMIKREPLVNLQTKINLSEQPNGVYFTRITEDGKPVSFSKIIKQ